MLQQLNAKPTMLIGDELKAKVAELQPAPESEIAIACGYATKAGKARIAAFKDALLVAHGLGLKKAPRTGTGRGRELGYRVTATAKGAIILAAGYGQLIGVQPGAEVVIAREGDTLVLKASGVTTLAEPSNSVVTYDSPERELAPF